MDSLLFGGIMKIKKIIISLIFVFSIFQIALFFNTFLTFDEVQAQEIDTGYKITAYDININVGENNVYNINETITVNYLVSRHGIIRNIPTLYSVVRADNTKAKQYSKISKMKISMDGLPTKFLLIQSKTASATSVADAPFFILDFAASFTVART